MLTRFFDRRRAIAQLSDSIPDGLDTYEIERAAMLRYWFGDAEALRLLASRGAIDWKQAA